MDRGAIGVRKVFLVALLLLTALKLALAWSLPLFGDEAFYWQESRALAPGYSDVPPLVPWLIRLGTWLGGHAEWAVRAPFLALGAMLPCLVVAWARRFTTERDAWMAGIIALCLPLCAVLGLLALPDVPMTVAMLAAVIALERAMRRGDPRDWLLLGLALALGWLSHYRFVMFYLAGAVLLLATPAGRVLARDRRFWLAQAAGVAGLAPTLAFNAQSAWVAFRFQFVERHPWRFHADALLEPVVQALVTTPFLFAALLVAMAIAWRRRGDPARPHAILAATSVGLLGGFLVLGLFADSERVRFHWPLPAYLVALPLVPAVLRGWWGAADWKGLARSSALLAPALGAVLTLTLFALLWHGARAGGDDPGRIARRLADNASGWHEVGRWAQANLSRHAPDLVVADNFMLAAELDFAFGGSRPVHVLDHPLNRKHGRAAQLRIWQRDEAALQGLSWRRGLLLVQEGSVRSLERLEAYRSLCRRFGRVEVVDELVLQSGRAPYVAFLVAPRGTSPPQCEVPAFGYVDAPAPGARVTGASVAVRGWAIRERSGVSRVELLLDGEPRAEARYGLANARVQQQWPDSEDPNHPWVGFEGLLPLAGIAPGPHTLALRVSDPAGRSRVVARQSLFVE